MKILIAFLMLAVSAVGGEKPNILVIASELNLEDLGCYGGKSLTPNIDHLAQEGMRFTSAYHAGPALSSSEAAILTGKHPARLHITDILWPRPWVKKFTDARVEGQLPLEELTAAEILKANGYATGFFGRWALGGEDFGPKKQGFDSALIQSEEDMATYHEPSVAPATEQFLEASKDRPFFCFVAGSSHWFPPEKMNDQYSSVIAMIEARDALVGRLVKKVESLELAGRTIVVVTSGTHRIVEGSRVKQDDFPYGSGMKVPFIVRWPGQVPAGTVADSAVSFADLMPTFLALAGIDPMKSVGPLDGIDLTKVLRGEKAGQRSLFWHVPHDTYSTAVSVMLEGDWKLIEYLRSGECELYHLTQDARDEYRDLAKQETERTAALQQKLRAWRESIGAQMPGSDVKVQPITPATGIISMPAREAMVHGEKLKYEPQPFKNTLGYWVNKDDWAEWTFEVPKEGRFELDILQGCGKGSGGAEVEFVVGGQTFTTKVQDTGHFQNFVRRSLGFVTLAAGKHTLTVKPKSKPGPAVMDLREVRLIPAPEAAK